jgi:drug/metabolite transporter (DMT)-like permease
MLSSLLGVGGQILLKKGMGSLGTLNLTGLTGAVQTALQIGTTPLVWFGLGCYGIATMIWLIVLTRLDVSLAYPLLALNFVLVPLLGWLLLGEQVPSWRWVGIGIVLLGVTVVART